MLTTQQRQDLEHQAIAARELHRRRASNDLLSYNTYVSRNYITGKHIEALTDALEAVCRGDIKRLIVNMPRRHSKSLTTSILFPNYYFGHHPEGEIIQTGYSGDLCIKHSRDARSIYLNPYHHEVFPNQIEKEKLGTVRGGRLRKSSAHHWLTGLGGSYRAVGMTGTITGTGADLLIIDDPHKNREEAESAVMRDKVWDQYTGTLIPTLSPNGAIVIIMTRWHEDDLVGRLSKQNFFSKDQWVTLKFPAISENLEPLWPRRYTYEDLLAIKRDIGIFEWSAQYQQEPYLRGGNMFDLSTVKLHDTVDDFPDCRFVRFWDLASTTKERGRSDPDYTSGALVGLTLEKDYANNKVKHIWVKDIVRCQAEAGARNNLIIRTTKKDGDAVKVLVESVAGYKDAFTTLRDVLKGVRSVRKVTVTKDKVNRNSCLEPIFEAGNVHILKADWNDIFTQQFNSFPAGNHDDDVDSVSGGYLFLNKNMNAAQIFSV